MADNGVTSGTDSDGANSDSCWDEGSLQAAGVPEPYRFEPSDSDSDTDTDTADGTGEQGQGDARRLATTEWCSCGLCQSMKTIRESVCCQELDRTREKCEEGAHQCITSHPDFKVVCLNKAVLDTAYYQYRQQYGVEDSAKRKDEMYRHIAYRQLCRWCWQFLGKNIRRVMPSCAVLSIRQAFPSPDGRYQGFQLK